LAPTPRGRALERQLTGLQRRHFGRVFERSGKDRERGWREVMTALGDR
jgi:hypothetical protein